MEWKEKIERWYNEHIRKVSFGRDSGIFLIFLLISTVFWLLNQLSKETTAEVSFPVRFTDTGERRVIVNDLPGALRLTVRGQGYMLLKYKMRPWQEPLLIDLHAFPLRPRSQGDDHHFYLLTSYLKGYISDKLDSRMALQQLAPDTLWFVFDSLVRKKVPVRPDLSLGLARQYILREPPYTEPDSLLVAGPAMVLDTLSAVPTEHVEYRNVDKSFTEHLHLRPLSGVRYPVKKVTLHVEVEQFTEAVFTIPLTVEHLPDTLELRLFPARVRVSFRVGLSRYKKISPDMFRVGVDYRDLAAGRTERLPVKVLERPPRIENVRTEPQEVEYILEKKR